MQANRRVGRVVAMVTGAATGLGIVVVAGPVSPAAADSGHWQLTSTKEFSWAPAKLVSPLSFDGTSGFPYRWAVRGVYSGGQLSTVNVTEYNDLPPASSCNWAYDWTKPPATAAEGQVLPMTMTSSGSCSGNPWFWDAGFDFADIEPGVASGWTYSGVYYKPAGRGQATGSLTFPQASTVVNHAQNPGQMRLQIKAERWAVQYVYTWVKGADPTPAPQPQPSVVAPGAPQAVRIAAKNAKKATLSWSAPSTGSAVASYTVYARSKARGSKKWSGWATGTTSNTAITLTVRKKGSTVQAYIVAANSAGNGPASATVTKRLPR